MTQPSDPTPRPLGPVLIVEDDAAVRDSLRFALEVEGLEVRAYADPAALLREDPLPGDACLVLDQILPGLDGTELVRVLRGRGLSLPVLLMTVDPSGEVRRQAASAGILSVLEKPVDADRLVAEILAALAARGPGRLGDSPEGSALGEATNVPPGPEPLA